MSDCLSLLSRQGPGGVRSLSGWECLWTSLGEGEAERLPAGGGSGWAPVAVPAQQAAQAGRSAIWYRTSFRRPDHSGRVLLRFGGAFLAANVWLNGRLLGSHYGYFAAFGFDITSHLKADNLLVVCCESPIETDLARKRHVMGIFNDGDSRPYPSTAWFGLPEPYRWEVPLGLWRPVELEYVGPVALDWLRLRPRIEAGDTGRLELEARLRNLDGREMGGEVLVEVQGEGAAGLRLRREFRLAGATEQTVSMSLSIPGARRWSPWTAGDPVLYRATATVLVGGRDSVRVEDRFGFRDVAVRAAHDGWSVTVNGRPTFLRGANYMPGLRLDQLSEAQFRSDLELAKSIHLDVLRVHGHVLPEEFYHLADEAGVMVVADFPLVLSYAYHAGPEETRFFENAVREQVPEMVGMLHNRPSVVLWTAHDDPPWIAANSELADVHAVRQNYTIDQEARALIEQLDPSRTALAASGELDQHLYMGWREGSWRDFADVMPQLVSEFGAQSAPNLDSPVWEQLGAAWPVAGDDPGWLYAGFQPAAWAEHGAGLPHEWESLAGLVGAAQDYQANLLAYAIGQLRTRKFEPCWGAFVYQLTDSFPGFGFGLVDSHRQPKPALAAVADAFAPVRVVIDPVGFLPLHPWGFGWTPGAPVTVRLVVINDDPVLSGGAQLRWSVWRERGTERGRLAHLRDVARRKSYSGSAEVSLPMAAEPALLVTTLTLPLDAEGDYRLEADLRIPGRAPLASGLSFKIGGSLPILRRRPLLPAFLADRVVDRSSLGPWADGVRFTLRNGTRPAVLAGIGGLRLDGRELDAPRILIETEAGRLPLPRRLELPVGQPLTVLVELAAPLDAGSHQLEVDLNVPGVASGRVVITGGAAGPSPEASGQPPHAG